MSSAGNVAKLDASFQKLLQSLATLQETNNNSNNNNSTNLNKSATESVAAALDDLERLLTQIQLENNKSL